MLDLSLAKHFAWLLRSDVRQDLKSSDKPTERFAQWWLVNGRCEYPYWDDLNSAQIAWLQESAGKGMFEGVELSIPKMLRLVLSWRPDVIQKFTVNDKADSVSLMAWFYLLGMQEHRLFDAVSLEMIGDLDRPILNNSSAPGDETPAVTVLMALA